TPGIDDARSACVPSGCWVDDDPAHVDDRTSKFGHSPFVQLHEKATRRVAGDFLRALAAAVPYRIHTVLTDNGTHSTDPARHGQEPSPCHSPLSAA
ncbi:hypothetical protein KOE73_15915, partial [Acidomonas methanolica]|nr:hypothetical protein [Acidomonas methanolica]